MVRYSGCFDVKSRIILLYIQCKYNCLPRYSVFPYFQSLDVNSRSQYHFSHVKIDTWLEVNFAAFLRRGAKSSLSSMCQSTISGQSRLVCANLSTVNYGLSSYCCYWLVSVYKHDVVSEKLQFNICTKPWLQANLKCDLLSSNLAKDLV